MPLVFSPWFFRDSNPTRLLLHIEIIVHVVLILQRYLHVQKTLQCHLTASQTWNRHNRAKLVCVIDTAESSSRASMIPRSQKLFILFFPRLFSQIKRGRFVQLFDIVFICSSVFRANLSFFVSKRAIRSEKTNDPLFRSFLKSYLIESLTVVLFKRAT